MAVSYSWDSLWALFDRATTEEKIEIYRQLDMEHFIRGLSAEHQAEVLKNAPKAILQLVENSLYLKTKITLGMVQKPSPGKKSRSMPNHIIKIVGNY